MRRWCAASGGLPAAPSVGGVVTSPVKRMNPGGKYPGRNKSAPFVNCSDAPAGAGSLRSTQQPCQTHFPHVHGNRISFLILCPDFGEYFLTRNQFHLAGLNLGYTTFRFFTPRYYVDQHKTPFRPRPSDSARPPDHGSVYGYTPFFNT